MPHTREGSGFHQFLHFSLYICISGSYTDEVISRREFLLWKFDPYRYFSVPKISSLKMKLKPRMLVLLALFIPISNLVHRVLTNLTRLPQVLCAHVAATSQQILKYTTFILSLRSKQTVADNYDIKSKQLPACIWVFRSQAGSCAILI